MQEKERSRQSSSRRTARQEPRDRRPDPSRRTSSTIPSDQERYPGQGPAYPLPPTGGQEAKPYPPRPDGSEEYIPVQEYGPITPVTQPQEKKTFQVIQWFFVVLAFTLILWLGKILILDSPSISASEYNPISSARGSEVVRGAILARDGSVLAYTDVGEDGSEIRRYPYGPVSAHVVGYLGVGEAGLEAAYGEELTTASDFIGQLQSWASEKRTTGCNIQTTLDIDLMNYIYSQMGDVNGAVVISEASTGRTLALVSNPSFNPETLIDDWENIIADEESPLYARATMGLYPPGSVFKIITALAMKRNLPDYQDFDYECYGELWVDDQVITCHDHTVHGYVMLEDAFAYSCNGFFGTAGIRMGWRPLRQTADYVRLGETFGYPLAQSKSQMFLSEDDVDSMVAQTAMGQGETLVTPFSVNMLTMAIASDGQLYQPYLVDTVQNQEGVVLKAYEPQVWGNLMSQDEALYLQNLMKGVTEYGTASSLSYHPYEIYGKTGTAQVEDADSHSWFTGFTKVDGRSDLVFTVLTENGAGTLNAVYLTDLILSYYYGE